jgi:hypothetical protein
VPAQQISTSFTTNVNCPNATETVVLTLNNVNRPRPGVKITLEGFVETTSGAAATSYTVAIRRGTDATGTLIGEATDFEIQAAAGSDEQWSLDVEDTAPVDSSSYVLTVTVNGGAAAATALNGWLRATVPA